MKSLIIEYRGVDIFFDTENKKFTFSFDDSAWNEKLTYDSCTAKIDDFVKKNSNFAPFEIVSINEAAILKIVGKRKDGIFVYEEDGKKKQLSKWSENGFFLRDADADKAVIEYGLIESEIDSLLARQKAILASNKLTSLEKFKKKKKINNR